MSTNLPPIRPFEIEDARRLLEELLIWLAGLPQEEIRNHRYSAALEAVSQALHETTTYIRHCREGGNRDEATENRLARLWNIAGSRIQPYDGHFASLCYVKGSGWADEATWNAPENRDLPIRVGQILQRLRQLAENPPPRPLGDVPKWFPIAGVIFSLFAVLSLFYLLLAPQDISPNKHVIFDAWVAFCFAAGASFLGGNAKAHGRLPWLGKSPPIQFATAGGVAVFVVLFAILYYAYH